jgi:hypothetical protein
MDGEFLMADRQLRELGQAFQQRIGSLEAKQRALTLRAWPGAVRTEKSLPYFIPQDPAANSVITSIVIPAGRWLITASGSIGTTDVDAAPALYFLQLYAYDALTGEAFVTTDPENNLDAPFSYLTLPANPAGAGQYVTMTMTGDLIAQESTKILMACQGTAGRMWNLLDPRIRCLPV